jgi:multicomponent Na+:H+ antiporter subunit F
MTDWYLLVATGLLITIALALWRVARGPSRADRMMAAQLVGTSGIAIVLLLAAADRRWVMLDVAIVLSLLAALSVIAFAKSLRRFGYGDPEDDDFGDDHHESPERRDG